MFNLKLSSRLTLYSILVLLVSSVSSIILIISIDYRAERENIDQEVGDNITSLLGPAKRSINNLDANLAEDVVNGLLVYDYILAAGLYDELGQPLYVSVAPPTSHASRVTSSIPIKIDENNAGKLEITFDADIALASLHNRALTIIASILFSGVLLVILLIYMYTRSVANPLERIATLVADTELNDNKRIAHQPGMAHEFIDILSSINSLMDNVQSNVQQLSYQANHDALTGLPNRSKIFAHIEALLNMPQHPDWRGLVMYLDVDKFKEVNDSFGHLAGDHVLQKTAERMIQALPSTAMCARLSGDEFMAVVELSADFGHPAPMALELAELINEPIRFEGYDINVSCSIGGVLFNPAQDDLTSIIKKADIVLFDLKWRRTRHISFYDQEKESSYQQSLELTTALSTEGSKQHFSLHYQPKVDTKNLKIVGAEALMRWHHPSKGLISAKVFMPALEMSSKFREIDDHIKSLALTQLNEWVTQGVWDSSMRLSLNVHPKHITQDNFADSFIALLDQHSVDGHLIDLELTETEKISDIVKAANVMQQLKQLGITFSLDDFGTGHASIRYARELPISTLKIDQSIISEINNADVDMAFLEAVLSLAEALKLTTVAEGVETELQLKKIAEIDLNIVQGHIFYSALPADDLQQLLQKQSGNAT